jgi:O-methyltransferase involved in polyketide biosynthesis
MRSTVVVTHCAHIPRSAEWNIYCDALCGVGDYECGLPKEVFSMDDFDRVAGLSAGATSLGPSAHASLELLRRDIDRPSAARIYDCILGGDHHFGIDREFAEHQLEIMPDLRRAMLANRLFLGRAVSHAVSSGVRQFVDIGSGLPTAGNVHESADRQAPGRCRVVYVDNEPVTHAHTDLLLAGTADTRRHRAVHADYLEYRTLWRDVINTGVIDPEEPICLLVVAMLHFIAPEQEPEIAMEFYRRQLPPGSLLVISHGCDELDDPGIQQVVRNYALTTTAAHLRTRDEIGTFFGDFDFVAPGLVWTPEWGHTAQDQWSGPPAGSRYLAGVAAKSGAEEGAG